MGWRMMLKKGRFLLFFAMWAIPSLSFAYFPDTGSIISAKYRELEDQIRQGRINSSELLDELSSLVYETHVKALDYSEVWRALAESDRVPDDRRKVFLIYGYDDSSSGNPVDDLTRPIAEALTQTPPVDQENSFSSFSEDARDRRPNSRRSQGRNQGERNDSENESSDGKWNREHVFAKSKGGFGTEGPGADAHHLRASDVKFNSMRGNLPFVEGEGNARKVGDGWYPGDHWKGDVARMILYMYIRYPKNCSPLKIGIDSEMSPNDTKVPMIFVKWAQEDQPDEIEKQRNEYLGNANNESGQGNRNPFIDHNEWIQFIWGE